MKKKSLLIMIICMLFLTGCNKTTECTLTYDMAAYQMEYVYKVTYNDNGDVVKTATKGIITSDDESLLQQLESSANEQYAKYQGLDHYKFSLKRKDGKLIEEATVNYKKLDMNKMLQIDSSMESLLQNGKIKYDTLVSVYKGLGAVCVEK